MQTKTIRSEEVKRGYSEHFVDMKEMDYVRLTNFLNDVIDTISKTNISYEGVVLISKGKYLNEKRCNQILKYCNNKNNLLDHERISMFPETISNPSLDMMIDLLENKNNTTNNAKKNTKYRENNHIITSNRTVPSYEDVNYLSQKHAIQKTRYSKKYRPSTQKTSLKDMLLGKIQTHKNKKLGYFANAA